MSRPVKAVVFDWNGTLLDDLDFSVRLLNDLLAESGHDSVSKQRYTEIFGFPIRDYYERAGFDLEKEDYATLADKYMPWYLDGYRTNCRIHDGAIEFLTRCKKMGIKVALLSVTKDEYLAPQLAAFGLTGMFDRVMGLDDHYGRGKEALAERLIKELGVDARDVLFVGDTMHDFDVASIVGAQCTLINHGHQSKQRLLTKTERVVDTFAEIIL